MLEIELFTDPACPFAFSAEPVRQRLRWHYGNGLRWTPRVSVLTREPGEADKLAEGAPGLQGRYGMPIDPRPYARPASSDPACRMVVAARLHAPERAEVLLRHLRVLVMQGGLLDDPALLDTAAVEAYETAIANRDPNMGRRPKPETVQELLIWADEPVATAEIALVMQLDLEQAQQKLQEAGARWHPAGADGYWTLETHSS